ncbi:hypothetical protein RDE2_28530 [Rhodococcus sp. RDE2]|nr:hypothetical protein RDE2_28530 [Rhodococcus sp. RDE2]
MLVATVKYNDFASTGVTVVAEADMAAISDLPAGSLGSEAGLPALLETAGVANGRRPPKPGSEACHIVGPIILRLTDGTLPPVRGGAAMTRIRLTPRPAHHIRQIDLPAPR